MDENIKGALTEVRDYLIKVAAAAAIAAILEKIFMPKPTTIVVDDGIPAQLYASSGKKGKSQSVYVTTKKPCLKIMPALIFGAGALIATFLLNMDKSNNIETNATEE